MSYVHCRDLIRQYAHSVVQKEDVIADISETHAYFGKQADAYAQISRCRYRTRDDKGEVSVHMLDVTQTESHTRVTLDGKLLGLHTYEGGISTDP